MFTRHDVSDNQINSVTAGVYVINADGTGLSRLTFNTEEERGTSWSPGGTRIVFSCRRGGSDFEICVMNADGTAQTQLTSPPGVNLLANWDELRVHVKEK